MVIPKCWRTNYIDELLASTVFQKDISWSTVEEHEHVDTSVLPSGSLGGELLRPAAPAGDQWSGLDGSVPGAERSRPVDGGTGATIRPWLCSYRWRSAAIDLCRLHPRCHELVRGSALHPGAPRPRQDPDPGWVHHQTVLSSYWLLCSHVICVSLSSGHVQRHGEDAGVWAPGSTRGVR